MDKQTKLLLWIVLIAILSILVSMLFWHIARFLEIAGAILMLVVILILAVRLKMKR